MMLHLRSRVNGILALLYMGLSVARSAPSAGQRLVAEAERLLELAQQAQTNTYSHTPRIDEDAGLFESDCSSFVHHLLQKIIPQSAQALQQEPEHTRPRAIAFYESMVDASNPHWERIPSMQEAQIGDFICWREIQYAPFKNSGHIALLVAAPVRIDAHTYRCTVIDASKFRCGIGRNCLHILTNSKGQPLGYGTYKDPSNLRFKPMAIGRISAALDPQCHAAYPLKD